MQPASACNDCHERRIVSSPFVSDLPLARLPPQRASRRYQTFPCNRSEPFASGLNGGLDPSFALSQADCL